MSESAEITRAGAATCHRAATRRPAPGIVILALCVCVSRPTWAGEDCTPPPNEDCPEAIVFTTVDLPYTVTAPLGCFNDVIDKPYFDVFYRFDCQQSGVHFIDMCDSSGDTYIRVYAEGCGWSDGIELTTGDDECPGSPPNADPAISLFLQAGESYWLELGTWRAVPPWAPPPNSPYTLRVSLEGLELPDPCDGVGLPMTLVGDPGNHADTNGLGAVAGLYRIGLYEITNRDYVRFLNAVAVTDPNGLFHQSMTDSGRGGILRGGAPGTFVYWVKPSFGDKPVTFVTWLNAARYCNWLHNNMPDGAQGPATTESGAYDLSLPNNLITRTPGARWFLPTHGEWYKAAYYDPESPGADGGGTPDYWLYPTLSDTLSVQALADAVGDVTNPGPNVANYGGGADWNGENGNVTTVGGTTSAGPWGAFDMGGNLYELTETPGTPIAAAHAAGRGGIPTRKARGGDFANAGVLMSSPTGFAINVDMVSAAANIGFRVAAVLCPGDFDGDNDVDSDDAAAFKACFTGPDGGPVDPVCIAGDLDEDGDIDCQDWLLFLAVYGGEGNPPSLPSCASIPALTQWGLFSLALLILTAGTLVFPARRHQR